MDDTHTYSPTMRRIRLIKGAKGEGCYTDLLQVGEDAAKPLAAVYDDEYDMSTLGEGSSASLGAGAGGPSTIGSGPPGSESKVPSPLKPASIAEVKAHNDRMLKEIVALKFEVEVLHLLYNYTHLYTPIHTCYTTIRTI